MRLPCWVCRGPKREQFEDSFVSLCFFFFREHLENVQFQKNLSPCKLSLSLTVSIQNLFNVAQCFTCSSVYEYNSENCAVVFMY